MSRVAHVPQPYGVVGAAGNQRISVRGEGDGVGVAGEAVEHAEELGVRQPTKRHSATLPSAQATASSLPLGLKSTPRIWLRLTVGIEVGEQGRMGGIGDVPEMDPAAVVADGQQLHVGTEVELLDVGRCAAENAADQTRTLRIGQIDEAHIGVCVADREQLSVRAEGLDSGGRAERRGMLTAEMCIGRQGLRRSRDRRRRRGRRSRLPARRHGGVVDRVDVAWLTDGGGRRERPDPGSTVLIDCYEISIAGREQDSRDRRGVIECRDMGPACGGPDAKRAVRVAGRQVAAIGAEGERVDPARETAEWGVLDGAQKRS